MDWIRNSLQLLLSLSEYTFIQDEHRTLEEAYSRLFCVTYSSERMMQPIARSVIDQFCHFLKSYIEKRQRDKAAHQGMEDNLRYEVEDTGNYISELLEWVETIEIFYDILQHQWTQVRHQRICYHWSPTVDI